MVRYILPEGLQPIEPVEVARTILEQCIPALDV